MLAVAGQACTCNGPVRAPLLSATDLVEVIQYNLGYPNTSGLNEISSVRMTEFVRISEPVRICVVIACRMAVSTITVDGVIRGHHVYKAIWTP